MSTRDEHDLQSDEWDGWLAGVCRALDVDPGLVDVPLIHDLTRRVAHRYARPMAPVSAYVMGLALGAAQARGELGADPGSGLDAEGVARLLAGYVERIDDELPPGT